MRIISTCRMGPGTFEAKFIPLSMSDQVEKIIVVRKEAGPQIPKVTYQVLPRLCSNLIFNTLVTPFIIVQQVRKYKASLILAYHYVPHFYFAYFASVITGRPYILGQTGSDDQLLAKRPMKGWFLRHILKHALQFNVPGKHSLDIWLSMGIERVRVLHSTIDTDYYVPSHQEKLYDFVYTGRLEDYKGVDLMIEAATEMKRVITDFKFAIVGYGSGRQRYEARVRELGLTDNIVFLGYQSDIRQWLHKSRIFVMASDCEGLPCALMEAMSCGMICMTSIVGNIGDLIIEGETGFGFKPRDKKRMVDLMILLSQKESELQTVRERARALVVKEHSHELAIVLWNDVLQKLNTSRI